MAKKKPSFEEALQRLKEITETLERGDVTLEESIKLFGEGTELSKLCYETLTDGGAEDLGAFEARRNGGVSDERSDPEN